ncbi:MAG TPA: hypothetical protein VG435_08770 [Acidimicrobiales bacterium]|jgi:hypothetical protein|nr:hypothetical protein [Acidimicrobiales bacterium]
MGRKSTESGRGIPSAGLHYATSEDRRGGLISSDTPVTVEAVKELFHPEPDLHLEFVNFQPWQSLQLLALDAIKAKAMIDAQYVEPSR